MCHYWGLNERFKSSYDSATPASAPRAHPLGRFANRRSVCDHPPANLACPFANTRPQPANLYAQFAKVLAHFAIASRLLQVLQPNLRMQPLDLRTTQAPGARHHRSPRAVRCCTTAGGVLVQATPPLPSARCAHCQLSADFAAAAAAATVGSAQEFLGGARLPWMCTCSCHPATNAARARLYGPAPAPARPERAIDRSERIA